MFKQNNARRHFSSIGKIAIAGWLMLVEKMAGYEATVPVYDSGTDLVAGTTTCIWEYCSPLYPMLPASCKALNFRTPPCSSMYGCGYSGLGQAGDPCATNSLVS